MNYRNDIPRNDTPRSDKSEALGAITRQAKARRLRNLIGVIAIAVLLVCNVALSVTALLVGLDSNARAADTHNKIGTTLNIAQRATDPKSQQKQLQAFYGTETAIFRSDCFAKAHQFAYHDTHQNPPPQSLVDTYSSFCSIIQPPATP